MSAGGPVRAPILEVYDLQGRLVLRVHLEQFRKGSDYAIPIEFLRRLGMGRLVLVLRGAGKPQSFSLYLGGRP